MKKFIKVIIFVLVCIVMCSCDKELITVKEKLDFEINSEVKYSDLVIENDQVTVLDGSELIDTSSLGSNKVVIKYLVDDKPYYKTVNVNIVDTTGPVIKYKESISTTKGNKVDLLSGVTVSDNSKENIKASVIGDYDINKVGTYNLKYYAVDSSGNSTTNDFTLTVKNITVKTSGYYVYKAKDHWEGITFKKNNKVSIVYNFCPGSGCGGYQESGTYSIKDNTVTLKITSYSDEMGTGKTKSTLKCTIKSESKIVCNSKYTFTWKNKFN